MLSTNVRRALMCGASFDGKEYFSATDYAKLLGYANPMTR
jgi:prophage antirepressor-like protein